MGVFTYRQHLMIMKHSKQQKDESTRSIGCSGEGKRDAVHTTDKFMRERGFVFVVAGVLFDDKKIDELKLRMMCLSCAGRSDRVGKEY